MRLRWLGLWTLALAGSMALAQPTPAPAAAPAPVLAKDLRESVHEIDVTVQDLYGRREQRRLADGEAAVISLYARGMTTGDIQAHLERPSLMGVAFNGLHHDAAGVQVLAELAEVLHASVDGGFQCG